MRNCHKWLLLAGLVIAMVAVGCHKTDSALVGAAGTADNPDSYPIWAGDMKNQFQVGHLDVWEDWTTVPTSLHVKYVLTEPNWNLAQCQLAVAVALESIPQRNGNPIPKKFEWDSGPLAGSTEHEFSVPFAAGWDVNEVLYLAAYCELTPVAGGKPGQTEAGWGGTEPFPGKNWALYCLYVIDGTAAPSGSGFRTVTQGNWGAPPEGDNWGQYLADHFGTVFDDKLQAGYGNWLLLTSPQAVEAYLPDFGVPAKLSKTVLNPNFHLSVFAGQVVALMLNVKFDSAFADFAPSAKNLKDLYVVDPAGPFHGWTVRQVLDQANKVLGGYGDYTPGEMNLCVTKVNENHVDLGDNHFLSANMP